MPDRHDMRHGANSLVTQALVDGRPLGAHDPYGSLAGETNLSRHCAVCKVHKGWAERFQGKRISELKDLGFEGCRSEGGHKVKGF